METSDSPPSLVCVELEDKLSTSLLFFSIDDVWNSLFDLEETLLLFALTDMWGKGVVEVVIELVDILFRTTGEVITDR